MDRGVFVDRTEAEQTTIGELIDRYLSEVTPTKKSRRNETQRFQFLRNHFGHSLRGYRTHVSRPIEIRECAKERRVRPSLRNAACRT